MDSRKVGALIKSLRVGHNMTQLQLAEKLNVTDRAVSKWERGEGCPDITLISKISYVLGASAESLLNGSIEENQTDGGNMKRVKFYVCPNCGNIITSTGEAEISCCGKKLQALEANQIDEAHKLNVTYSDDEMYITFAHEMSKEHFISFIAYVELDKVFVQRLYPEQSQEILLPKMHGGKFYIYCNKHGMFVQE